MTDRFAQLGPFSDLADVARGRMDRPAGDLDVATVRRLLGFDAGMQDSAFTRLGQWLR